MLLRSKNLAILVTILILGGVLLILASLYFEVDSDNLIACTEEAKVCSDGSTVVRGGPNCEFPACPEVAGDLNETPEVPEVIYNDFKFALEEAVRIEIGQPIEGYEPQMFMQVFPGLKPQDFDGVDAQIGYYLYYHGELYHEYEVGTLLHSAAPAITQEGMDRLFENVTWRMGYDTPHYASVDEVINFLLAEPFESPTEPIEIVACSREAKICPDGSYVGRVSPNCEFAPCPDSEWPINYGEDVSKMEKYRFDCEQRNGIFNECGVKCPPNGDCLYECLMTCEGPAGEHMPPVPSDTTFCPPASRGVEACIEIYQPVCGMVEVECITTPCNPVPETFSNSCFACMNERVISYTEGECVNNQ